MYAEEWVRSFDLESSNFLEARCDRWLGMALELKGYTLKY